MKVMDTNTYSSEPFWRRWAHRCAVYAEALETSLDEHQNQRLSTLETEVATLRRLLSERS